MLKKLLGDRETIHKLIRFCVIGAVNTAVDYGVFTLLVRVFAVGAIPAQVIAYSCGVVNSYVWNRSWTFRAESRFFSMAAVRFLIANLITLGLSLGLMHILTATMHWDELLAKLPTTALTIGVNFLLSHLWVFRGERGETDAKVG